MKSSSYILVLLAIISAVTDDSKLCAQQTPEKPLGSIQSLAGEIYFSRTSPLDVAGSLVNDHPHAKHSDGKKLRLLSGPGLTEAISPDGICLVQAGISPISATPQGHQTHETQAQNAAKLALQSAAAYRYSHNQGGGMTLWNIQFDGVPAKQTEVPQNFFPNQIANAIAYARTLIRSNPNHTGPDSGYALIFQAAYEATVPYTWSGNEWCAKAEKDRLGMAAGGALLASIDTRLTSLQTACDRYRSACEAFLAFFQHEVEGAWLLQPQNYVGSAGPSWIPLEDGGPQRWTWAQMLYQAYVEAVTQLAQGKFDLHYTQYLKVYGAGDHSLLIAQIRASAAEIDRLMLPISAILSKQVLDPEIDTSRPASHSALLRRLADHVVERAIFFSPGVNPLSGGFSYSTYGPNHVPFLVPAQLASRPFSFDNFLAFTFGIDGPDVPRSDGAASATSQIGVSIKEDEGIENLVDQVIQKTKDLNDLREETRTGYESQLKQLCGQRLVNPDVSDETVPDIQGCLLPTEGRQPTPGKESLGDIALQWNKIEQAEIRLFSAYRALVEIDEEAQIIREYGNERMLSYDRIAKIQLNTGEQISALDYLSGEIRAKSIEAEAEQRAKQAEKKNWYSTIAKGIGTAVATYASGGTFLAIAAVSSQFAGDLQSASDTAKMYQNIGRIQADATRRQAEIAAQQTQIRAVESAKITIENATQEDNRIRESIHKLMIRVERQKLEILLAQQQLDFAEIEHANMIGRISNLLEEYRRVTLRNATSTLNRPDVRLQRDYQIQEAARTFRVAQEYAFLCARAAKYRFAGKTTAPFLKEITQAESNILKAQNGKQLEVAVSSLIETRGKFLNATGGMELVKEIRISLRDSVIQSNSVYASDHREKNGSWLDSLDPNYLYPPAGATTGERANDKKMAQDQSDEHFVEYLKKNLRSTAGGQSKVLSVRFPIGFEPTFGERFNPLRERTSGEHGHVIVGPGPSYDLDSAVGVFINIRNRGVNPRATSLPQTGVLDPVGAFYTTRGNTPASTEPIKPQNIHMWQPIEKTDHGQLGSSVLILYNEDTLTSAWKKNIPALTLGSAGSKLHERSPANDQWVLEIEAPNSVWDNFLPNMRDIEICMTIRGWSN